MYEVKKVLEIAGAHCLNLEYESKCRQVHGHNWIVTIYCRAAQLNSSGMVVDFTHIKQRIHGVLDHTYLNDILEQPTAENMALWICDQIPECYRVDVQESEGNVATYVQD